MKQESSMEDTYSLRGMEQNISVRYAIETITVLQDECLVIHSVQISSLQQVFAKSMSMLFVVVNQFYRAYRESSLVLE